MVWKYNYIIMQRFIEACRKSIMNANENISANGKYNDIIYKSGT